MTPQITAFEILGTSALFDVNGQSVANLFSSWQSYGFLQLALQGSTFATSFITNTAMYTGLNSQLVKYVPVPYAAAFFPMSGSISEGTNNGINLINENPGNFVIWGWSQGGIVASNLYDQIRSGVLSSRNSNFLGAAVFGNPRRQAGHTFPLCSDPGGEGVFADDLLTSSETRWFDFANPGDGAATNDDTTVSGQAATAMVEFLLGLEVGTSYQQDVLLDFLSSPVYTIINAVYGMAEWWYSIGAGPTSIGIPFGTPAPHLLYGVIAPLAPIDSRTSVTIALDYMHSLALGWNACTTAPVATSIGSGQATVEVAVPTLSGTYTYSINAWNSTTSTQSTPTISGSPSIGGGNATITVTGLTVGDSYTFSVTLGTTYTEPAVAPTSMMSNSITASSGLSYTFPFTLS